jgi:probable rRNA maturation factor
VRLSNHKLPARFRLEIRALTGGQYVSALRRQLVKAHGMLVSPLAEISIAIVPARQMALLHERYLGESGPTDVLTFELDHDSRGRVIAGEVIICHSVARERARQLGHSVERELLLYGLHGMLHLCGFDDRTPADFKLMHAREDEILIRLGAGPVFSKRSS